jgi:kynureninase
MTETATRSISEEEAARFRAEFPIFDHTTYLNSCSLGPLSRDAIAALQQFQNGWSQYGAPAWWKLWLPKLQEAKERFAALIGAGVHEVTISHSVSSALSSIASTFDYGDRSTVVCTDLDFPTIAHQWLVKAHTGVQLRFARSSDRIHVPVSAFEKVMSRDVAHIATSHALYATGYVQDVRRLADLAHSNGAKIVIDGYHSVGVFPVNVKELDVDFYVGGTLKWLLGGPGLTFIYVREDLLSDLKPSISGWFAAANQFAFDTLQHDLSPTADRLELGTPAVGTAYTGVAGMDLILRAEPERIYPRLQMLTNRIVDRARADGYTIMSPENPDERGGIVMLHLNKPEETVNELANRGYTVDYRPGLLRVSPHFYNTINDVDRLMDELKKVQSA